MRVIVLIAAVAMLSACAAGNRYDYRNAVTGLPLSGNGTISVDVVDARAYVMSGEKSPDFVGLQRGGYGNPFDVRTASGAPLADELDAAIEAALARRGYTITDATQSERALILTIREWKTDVMMRMKVTYDLTLDVIDQQGRVIASSQSAGEEVLGGAMQSQNAANAALSFETRLTELLRDEGVRSALGHPR